MPHSAAERLMATATSLIDSDNVISVWISVWISILQQVARRQGALAGTGQDIAWSSIDSNRIIVQTLTA